VVEAVDLDESGVGDVVSEVAPERKRHPRVVATVEDERRHADRSQDRADVGIEVTDGVHPLERPGAERQPLES
jgi:hypothetical protein